MEFQKKVLITGSTDGIGKATAIRLARQGVHVIIHGRTPEKTYKTLRNIRSILGHTTEPRLNGISGDFTSLEEIKNMSKELHKRFDSIDILINNAAVIPLYYKKTKDKFEETFQVNYLAAFSLTLQILDLIAKAPQGRIISVSSMIHSSSLDLDKIAKGLPYNAGNAYSDSKLAILMFAYTLARKLKNLKKTENMSENLYYGLKRITSNALHPGVISTKLLHTLWGGGADPDTAAKRLEYLALSPELNEITGKYFMDNKPTKSANISYNLTMQDELWKCSLKWAKLKKTLI